MLLLEPKDPNEVIYYDFDWGPKRLEAGETIITFGWEISGGSAVISSNPPISIDGTKCRCYVEGGQLNEVSILTNWVETNLNPRRDFSGKLKIKAK
jgi:hypothetical protein